MASEAENTVNDLPSIAVGCIAFATEIDIAKDSRRFFSELEKALSSVENVTELRLENTKQDYNEIYEIKDPFDKVDRFYSHPYGGLIYYKIFIPFKVQDDIGFRCEDETFEVFNFHHNDFLVTYVLGCVAGGSCGGGSTSLALIREYLKAKLVDGPMKVAIVGPSPFHATFWALEGAGRPELKDVTVAAGSREYQFHYDPSVGYLFHFMERYGDTLALYYFLQSIRNIILTLDREIDRTVENLLLENRSVGERLRFQQTVRSEIDKIHRKVIEGKSLKRLISVHLERATNDRHSYHTNDLPDHFAEVLKISQEDSYDNALSIATIQEGRNRSFYQNSAVLIAGLVGGLFGALLTSLISSG